MILYGLKNCDTCRKALKSLPDAKFVDVREDGVPPEVLRRAYDLFGADLLNTRSTTWRSLDEGARAGDPLDLIGAHPLLMKRPLITEGDRMWLGWGVQTRIDLGVQPAPANRPSAARKTA